MNCFSFCSYVQTLIHLFKGNIGPGLFAMGYAFKNGGYVVAPILTVLIALISIHCQHVLIKCAQAMKEFSEESKHQDYAETVEQCFQNGPEKFRSWSTAMRRTVNIFICVTQLGMCCIYFVFISTNLAQVFKVYGIHIDFHYVMLISFVPILLTSLITNLRWLTPVSLLANICMIVGISITYYYAFQGGLPDIKERKLYTTPLELALYFGIAIFAFEGIALVLPLKNTMKEPSNFDKPLGVLNVGMFIVTTMFIFTGLIGYHKWGDDVKGSLTLSLGNSTLAQCVKVIVSCGVLLGYPLQFFIAIQIMWPNVLERSHCSKYPLLGELGFRTLMVILTCKLQIV